MMNLDFSSIILDSDSVHKFFVPTSVLMSSLNVQLGGTNQDEDYQDYVTPVIETVNILKNQNIDDSELVKELDAHLYKLLGNVVRKIESNFDGITFSELGLDTDSHHYPVDVAELYNLFISDRFENTFELLKSMIISERKRFLKMFKVSVDKRNQTVSETRKMFNSFDDAIIWLSVPNILDEFLKEVDWSMSLSDTLDQLEYDVSNKSVLAEMRQKMLNVDFAYHYIKPVLESLNSRSILENNLRSYFVQNQSTNVSESE